VQAELAGVEDHVVEDWFHGGKDPGEDPGDLLDRAKVKMIGFVNGPRRGEPGRGGEGHHREFTETGGKKNDGPEDARHEDDVRQAGGAPFLVYRLHFADVARSFEKINTIENVEDGEDAASPDHPPLPAVDERLDSR